MQTVEDDSKKNQEKPKRMMDAKGQINLDNPEALIAEAIGLMRYQDAVSAGGALSKLDLFGGPLDPDTWNTIQEYIGSGSRGNLDPKERRYLDLLTLIFSLDGQYGKRNTIRFLMSPYFSFTYEQAGRMYSEAIEMFYANRGISKDAMRQKTADQLDAAYTAAFNAATTAKDFKNAAEILEMKAKVLGLDKEDAKVLETRVYMKSFRVLSLTASDIGLPVANRRELAEMIDSLPVSDSDRKRISMEAGIIDMDIVEMMENESQEAD